MSKLTKEQIEFARRMTMKQWQTLRALAMFPFYLSASERGDPESYALIREKLAQCATPVPDMSALFMWMATDAGKAALKLRDAGKL